MNQNSAEPPESPPNADRKPRLGRRRLLRTAMGAAVAAPLVGMAASSRAAEDLVPAGAPLIGRNRAELVLIGTAAGPVPMAGRAGISSALVVNGRVYVVDLGHGAFDGFERAGLRIADLDAVFITHLHSDHIADLYTLPFLRFGGIKPMTHPLHIYGPGRAGTLPRTDRPRPVVNPANPTPGLTDLVNAQMAGTAYDLNLRMRDEGWPDIRGLVRTHDIAVPPVGAGPHGPMAPPMRPFPVMSDDNVKVSAILVEHPPVFPSFAFRFDTEHGSVVFSGDTTITPNVVTLARGADVLVHEVIAMRLVRIAGNLSPDQVKHHENSHSDVARVGREVAQKAGVERLVLSHLAPGDRRMVPDAVWKVQAGRGYDGRVIVGDDGMRVPL
ncbi:MBL fold metallo-hydrolase [Actinomadura kijaniata]|uniref:Ribonuclease BN (tRNA processing enzyme) n=1 Tax=Actinomadura namibiensis TaxID=182080 RepID=A0A7W3QKQ6_ACTNM|nr:MBL fold metallo-hydrolase [Actinomadura namibiensis]MBA8950682.1 ribonuclease BN (tRNA processing enzyme) [Actinomadura namibiensis]